MSSTIRLRCWSFDATPKPCGESDSKYADRLDGWLVVVPAIWISRIAGTVEVMQGELLYRNHGDNAGERLADETIAVCSGGCSNLN